MSSATAAGCTCSGSRASRTPTSRATRSPGTEYDVDWVEIEVPYEEYAYTPGQPAPTSNDTALTAVGRQGWEQGAAFFSRLEGQVYSKGEIFFTSTQGGGAAEPGMGPDSVAGFGNGSGQVWAYDPKREKLRVVYQSPDRATLDFPDNITTSNRGTLVVCEDNTQDNFIRGLSPEGDLWDIALNRLTSSTGRGPLRRRVRRLDVQPHRSDAVREHPGLAGHDVRDLGTLGSDRRLTSVRD